MKYRIKVIQKNNNNTIFIPQYRKDEWVFYLVIRIIFSPLVFIWWVFCDLNHYTDDIIEYFGMWYAITTDDIFDNEHDAHKGILFHKQHLKDEEEKYDAKKHYEKMNEIKKTSYININ